MKDKFPPNRYCVECPSWWHWLVFDPVERSTMQRVRRLPLEQHIYNPILHGMFFLSKTPTRIRPACSPTDCERPRKLNPRFRAFPRGTTAVGMLIAAGENMAAPIPWKALKIMNCVVVCAPPEAAIKMAAITHPPMLMMRLPILSAIVPANSRQHPVANLERLRKIYLER